MVGGWISCKAGLVEACWVISAESQRGVKHGGPDMHDRVSMMQDFEALYSRNLQILARIVKCEG